MLQGSGQEHPHKETTMNYVREEIELDNVGETIETSNNAVTVYRMGGADRFVVSGRKTASDMSTGVVTCEVSKIGELIKALQKIEEDELARTALANDRQRAIALYRLATMLKSNKDLELHHIAQQCNNQALRYAKKAGVTQYREVQRIVTGEDGSDPNDISAIMD